MRQTRAKAAVLAVVGLSAATIIGCNEDQAQQNPLAPSAIATETGRRTTGTDALSEAVLTTGDPPGLTTRVTNAPQTKTSPAIAEPNSTALEIDGRLPPGISRAYLEARLAGHQATFGTEWTTTNPRMSGANRGATRPGMHRITRLSASKLGIDYQVRLQAEPPSPQGDSDSKLIVERLRDDGRLAEVGNRDVSAGLMDLSSILITRRDRTSHNYRPGWYVFWLAAQNCENNHCAYSRPSVKTLEIEEEAEEEEAPPEPPSLHAWSTNSWMCSDPECVASGSVSLTNAVAGMVDVQIRGRLSFRDAAGAAFDETINISIVPQDGEIESSFPTQLRQGRYLVELRQRRAPDGPWSNWKARTGRMQVEPTASELAEGQLPGAPRNVILDNVGTNRWKISWDPPSNPGGWQVRDYRIGDTGTTPPYYTRVCKGSGWPHRTARHHSTGAGDNGRQFGHTVAVHLPDGWTISVSAVNARGEGDCTAAPVPD